MENTLLCTEEVALQAIVVFVFARGLDEKKYIVLIPLPSLIKKFVRSFVRSIPKSPTAKTDQRDHEYGTVGINGVNNNNNNSNKQLILPTHP